MQIPIEALPSFRDNPLSSGVSVAQNATLQDTDGWFHEWLTGGGKTTAGQSVSEASALKVATVFACVRNISEDIAKLPLILYKSLKPRGKERATSNPLYRILHDSPNRDLDSFTWRQSMTADALCGGNGYSEIVRNGAGEVQEIHYLPRQRMLRTFWAEGWKYEVLSGDGSIVIIDSSNMFHLKGMGGDGISGWSVIRLARETIGGAMGAEEHANSFFGDSAIPSGILEHPATMKKEAREHLIKTWEARHQNKRKLAVLEGGLKYNALSVSNQDSQFLESRQFSVEEICRWFRVPPHKVMHLLRSTFSNIEEQNIEYVVDCLTSWGVRWEQEIKRKLILVRQPDLFAEILFEGLLRGDSIKRADYMQKRFMSGSMSPNDIRDKEGENPVEGGDEYFVPVNMVTLERAINPPEPVAPQQATAELPQTQEPNDDTTQQNRRETLIAAHADVLADAVGRLLKIEAAHLEKHAGKPNGANAIEKFYREHAPVVNATLPSPIEAFGVSYWLAWAATMPDEAKIVVIEHGNRSPFRHVAMSRGEMTAADACERWNNGTRAAEFARAELEQLADRLDAMLARYRPDYLRGDAA